MGKKVSAFVCGVQKAGTTSLHAYLSEHPDLSPPNRKELHVFDDETLDWTTPDYGPLHASFSSADGSRLRFESTPIYAFWPPSIARIAAYNPAANLIFLFRDPFERAWSHWCMEYARGTETIPFAEAIREGRRRLGGAPPLADEWRVFSYLERGLYAEQVTRALAHFPREQMLFLRSEDLRSDHQAVLAQIAGFLGIAPFPPTGLKRDHARPEYAFPSEPSAADRRLVADLVAEDIRRFAVLTGREVAGWPISQFCGDASRHDG